MRNAGNHKQAARRSFRIAAVAGSAVLLLAVSACAGSSDAGSGGASASTTAPTKSKVETLLGPVNKATGSTIKLGFISDGATDAFDNTSELDAAKASVDYFNEHQAGVAGHKVELETCTTGGDPAGATDCGNQLVQKNVAAVALAQSAVAESAWEPINKAKIPMFIMAANGDSILKSPNYTYVVYDGTSALFSLPFSVAKQQKVKKLAFVVIDVPQAVAVFESTGPAAMKKAGLDYVLVKVPAGTADMTPQMQEVASSGAGLVHVIGNDAFCIAAFQGLQAVAYDGTVTSITQCITDATRKSAPPEILDGMYVTATAAVGASDDPSYQLYDAIMRTFAPDTKLIDDSITMQAYGAMSGLLTSLQGVKGDVTPDTANTAIKTMKLSEYPGAAGLKYQCGAGQSKNYPVTVCTNQTLQAQLDSKGRPTKYTVGEPFES
ncbi:ABC transporter substrate-binding protein [Aquihabitans sp. McL0605]|uniref:ABC transporter substrate-binding protein n=1 Tax=Aquihabitans sp. McL0605 TaxID=3415671 RepID=UPI003CF4B787